MFKDNNRTNKFNKNNHISNSNNNFKDFNNMHKINQIKIYLNNLEINNPNNLIIVVRMFGIIKILGVNNNPNNNNLMLLIILGLLQVLIPQVQIHFNGILNLTNHNNNNNISNNNKINKQIHLQIPLGI